jgi:hypothetical protein
LGDMVRSGGAWLMDVPAWRRVGNLRTLSETGTAGTLSLVDFF